MTVRPVFGLLAGCLLGLAAAAMASESAVGEKPSKGGLDLFTARAVTTYGSVSVEGRRIGYRAVAGTIVVHAKNWDDAVGPWAARNSAGTPTGPAVASISYFAYFKRGSEPNTRPITFLFNGGPGSSTVWLHMDAFGPAFLSRHDRWTSPKYLVGEGYVALRAGALINVLETQEDLDFNGVVFLSQMLNLGLVGGSSTLEAFNPGMDLPYELAAVICRLGLVSAQAPRRKPAACAAAGKSRTLFPDDVRSVASTGLTIAAVAPCRTCPRAA